MPEETTMKSKKDKIIVAVAGVALTIVFLIALIIGDTSGLKVNDGADKSTEKYADDNGTSLLIVNSKKGEEIFDVIGDNLVVSEKDFDEAVLGNPSFKVSVQPSKYSENFLRELDEIGFSRAYKKYARESWKNIIKAKLQYVIDVFAAIRYMIFYCCNNMNKIFKYHKTN